MTKIFPSPIFPVLADFSIASITVPETAATGVPARWNSEMDERFGAAESKTEVCGALTHRPHGCRAARRG